VNAEQVLRDRAEKLLEGRGFHRIVRSKRREDILYAVAAQGIQRMCDLACPTAQIISSSPYSCRVVVVNSTGGHAE
jgi:hypothetical protein